MNPTHRIDFFLWIRSTELILFLWIWPKNWTLISWIWRKELDFLFLEYDAMNWTVKLLKYDAKNSTLFFLNMNSTPFLNMTQRIELFLLSMTQRFGPFFKYDGKNWTLFSNMKERNVFFFPNMTQRIFLYESKNGNFLVRVKELNFFDYDSWNWTLFFEYDSKNWTFFQYDSKYWFFQTKILTQRIQPLFLNMTQRTEPFFSDWKNWILIMTLRTQLFQMWQKIVFFLNVIRRI